MIRLQCKQMLLSGSPLSFLISLLRDAFFLGLVRVGMCMYELNTFKIKEYRKTTVDSSDR